MNSDFFLFPYMESMIGRLHEKGQYRTSETYSTTLNSFRRFRGGEDILLTDITSSLLESYECYLRGHDLSPNTISFYMKHLRSVYNRAVEDGLIFDRRPFKRVFTSIEKTAKRAVSLKHIKQLKNMDLGRKKSRQFARDIFLFSFYTRGMSFVDIAYLQKKNLTDGSLEYRRKKTGQQLVVAWDACMQDIVDTYATDSSSPYLFPIIRDLQADTRKQYQRSLFRVNRHLKKLGKELGLHKPLTMYCARHSWATIAHDNGMPLSVISEGMGHESEKTTRIYLASIRSEAVDKANRKILKLL